MEILVVDWTYIKNMMSIRITIKVLEAFHVNIVMTPCSPFNVRSVASELFGHFEW